jgi:hypothetical protein
MMNLRLAQPWHSPNDAGPGPAEVRGTRVVQKNRPHPATTEMMMKQSYLKTTLLLLLMLMVMREPAGLHFFLSHSRTPNTSNKRQTNEEISLDVIIFLQEGGVMF